MFIFPYVTLFHVLEVPYVSACICVPGRTGVFGMQRDIESQSDPVGLRCFDPLFNCVYVVGSCAVRTVPPSVVSCDLYEQCVDGVFWKRGFGLNITSKETHLPLLLPPVTSLQRGKLLSLPACCWFSALFEGFCTFFLFSTLMFVCLCVCLYQQQTGVCTEILCSTLVAEQYRYEMSEQEITGLLQSTPYLNQHLAVLLSLRYWK